MDVHSAETILSSFDELDVLVVGDLMIDEYLWGEVERISPEAPVQIVDVDDEEQTLGGAGNVVKNLIDLGVNVSVASILGESSTGEEIHAELGRLDVDRTGVVRDARKVSSRKTRVMSNQANQQMLRIDRETTCPATEESEEALRRHIDETIDQFDAVILSDYGKGVLTESILESVLSAARDHNVASVVDPKGDRYGKYRGATMIAPNDDEAAAATGVQTAESDGIPKAGQALRDTVEAEAVLITQGAEGMSLFTDEVTVTIPTRAKEVYDVSGAGDTVVSLLGACLGSGTSFETAARLSNVAAGIVVGKVGTATVTRDEITTELNGSGGQSEKIVSRAELIDALETSPEETVVFTNGCFDILHVGHVQYLQEASTFGDRLVVGLNSDDSVRTLKGEPRPIVDQNARAQILAALDCVDYVTIFDERTPRSLIREVDPDVLVKGSDYDKSEVVGREIVESSGGRVELVDLVEGVSTTAIIQEIRDHHDDT
jgi:D-beta-D-heptose 7-phosphate kinase/D-beta-D-heptose 1-phosphate adenosyltransferase